MRRRRVTASGGVLRGPGRLRERMLAGDAVGSWQVVESAMASGVEPADVYVEILAPALHGSAPVGVGQHPDRARALASGVASTIIGRLGPLLPPSRPPPRERGHRDAGR